MKECLICVDAGGTKTEVVGFTLDGKEIAKHIGGSGNFAFDAKTAVKNIFSAVETVYEEIKNDYEPLIIQMGISGYGAYKDKEGLIHQFQSYFNTTVHIVDDARLALYSILKDQHDEGVLILAGTGSACFGIKGEESLLIGGWGHLLGDEGSAHHLVLQTFKLMITDEDEGRPARPIAIKMLEHLGLDNTFDLKQYVYGHTKAEVASNSQYINELAEQGDEDAKKLLVQSGHYLAKHVELMVQRLALKEDVIIGCQGSFILNSKTVKEAFKEKVYSFNPQAIIHDKPERPVVGAYYLGLRHINKGVS